MRAVIAEDHPLIREGLTRVLESGGVEVVGVAGTADELLEEVAKRQPELVVTDIRMPPTFTDEGLIAALEIRRTRPSTAVLVLSQFVHRQYALELMEQDPAGVGYLLKQRIGDLSTFLGDVDRICHGGTVIDPEVVAGMLARAAHNAGLERITRRQREVLELMAAGRSNSSIAQQLFITEKAVVQHVSGIYDTLGLPVSSDDHRRVLAVLRYLNR
ncbi:MAG: response regulator transcription factor [Microlunatus sp.]|nr:response regulator transcription factor [Microlunatus sp.]MDN5769304.1 response regulator transcription factor [Microlunatus sp.]